MTQSPQVSPTPSSPPAGPARRRVPHALAVRHLTVVAVLRVTPSIVRVTLAGPGLAGFESGGPTDHVKVFFPDTVTGELAAPTLTADGLQPPAHGTAISRLYTPRAYRARGGSGFPELDLDLVLHGGAPGTPGEVGEIGPAAAWAARAAVGDALVVAGPKTTKLVPEGFTSFLLGCDETALPAVARWLELLPAGTPVRVLAEISSVEDEAYLPTVPRGTEVLWLRRHGLPGTSPVLEQAFRACGPIGAGTYVWAGGEAGSLVGVRRYLRRELALPPHQVEFEGFWRRGTGDFDHHAPIDPTDAD